MYIHLTHLKTPYVPPSIHPLYTLYTPLHYTTRGKDKPPASENAENAFIVCIFFAKMFMKTSFSAIFVFTSQLYPTLLRATSTGSGSMFSRVGGTYKQPIKKYL